jgi:hypothetical protein
VEAQTLGEKMKAWFCRHMGHWICPDEASLIEYALDGLDQDSREQARRHLGHCRHCREQVRDFLLMNAGLALTAPESEPPQGLEDSILRRIREGCPAERPSTAPLKSAMPEAGRHWRNLWSVAGPLFALLCLGLAVMMTRAQGDLEVMGKVRFPLRKSQDNRFEREEKISTLLTSPNLVTLALSPMAASLPAGDGQEEKPSEGDPAWARLFLVDGENKAALFCRNFPLSRPGEAYALWCFTQQEGSPKKLCCQFKVTVAALERVWLELKEPLELKRKDLCFGVTREKDGADPQAPQGELAWLGKVKP